MGPTPIPGETCGKAVCPACGRYTATALVCPYCEVTLPDRGLLRSLRWIALPAAFAGLGLLWLAAHRTPLPVVPVTSLSPADAGRTRVQGAVVSAPRLFSRHGAPRHVRFDLDDGTGRVSVCASRRVARDLVAAGLLPPGGAIVEVTGNTAPGRDRRPLLYLEASSSLRLLELPRSLEPHDSAPGKGVAL